MRTKVLIIDVIRDYSLKMKALGLEYVLDEEDESTDEYVHFYFIGKFEGKDVIYDTADLHTSDFTMKVSCMKSLSTGPPNIFLNIKR